MVKIIRCDICGEIGNEGEIRPYNITPMLITNKIIDDGIYIPRDYCKEIDAHHECVKLIEDKFYTMNERLFNLYINILIGENNNGKI